MVAAEEKKRKGRRISRLAVPGVYLRLLKQAVRRAGAFTAYLWRILRWLAEGVLDLLAPLRCLCCDELLAQVGGAPLSRRAFPICGSCRPGIVRTGSTCPRCGELLASAEILGIGRARAVPRALCGACESRPPPQDSVSSSIVYEGEGKEILLAWKNSGEQVLLSFLVELLFRYGGGPAESAAPLVCSVPRHWLDRLLRRGARGDHLAQALLSVWAGLSGGFFARPGELPARQRLAGRRAW